MRSGAWSGKCDTFNLIVRTLVYVQVCVRGCMYMQVCVQVYVRVIKDEGFHVP